MNEILRELHALMRSLPPALPEAIACNRADAGAIRAAQAVGDLVKSVV